MTSNVVNGLLAGAAVMIGWWGWGWRGLALAVTVIVFWMLLQFGRAARSLRHAAQRPVGHVDSAVMFQAKLAHGMNMQEVIAITGSLGQKVSDADDWRWADAAGDEVVVYFRRGHVVRWALARAQDQGPRAQEEDPVEPRNPTSTRT
jgi:hypothetical protein